MNIGDTFQTAHNFLTGVEASYLFGPRKDFFFKTLQLVDADFCKLEKEEAIRGMEEQVRSIKDSLAILKSLVLSEVLTEAFVDFTRTFCLILNNWNENVAKSGELRAEILMVDRFVQNHFTSNELQGLLRGILQRLKDVQNVSMPAIELSRHYLASYDASPNKVIEGPGTIAKKEVKELPPAIAKRNAESVVKKDVAENRANEGLRGLSFNKSIQ